MKLPEKFIEKYKKILNEEFDAFIQSFQSERSYGLRINRLKCQEITNHPYLLRILKKNPLVSLGYYYDKTESPGKHPYHHAGVYYIQDPSAMMVVENADILEGDIVFDMCAAPGGKSTHILSKLNSTGLLISNEISKSRAKVLSENIERMGGKQMVVLSCDPLKLNAEFDGYFDKVIVDAPCSGEGMFRKEEKMAFEWNEEKVLSCSNIQLDLLNKAHVLTKENGIIIYSTCTYSPEENENTIDAFLKQHPDCLLLPTIKSVGISDGLTPKLKNCSRFYPHLFSGEGHFIAKIKKTAPNSIPKLTTSKSLIRASREANALFSQFSNQFLINFETSSIFQFNDHLYSLNAPQHPSLDSLQIVRYGLHLGQIKKQRFEPSHSLALALKKEQAKYVVNFSSEDPHVLKYLRGETIPLTGNNQYTLITVDGFSLGWAKHVDGVLKNHFPKGLRIM